MNVESRWPAKRSEILAGGDGPAKAKQSYGKEESTNPGHNREAAPDNFKPCATIENCLREIDIVRRRKNLNDGL